MASSVLRMVRLYFPFWQKVISLPANVANTRYISAVINVRFRMNYASFVNKYRIEDAMTILADKRYKNLTMEDVADMVGFANRQSFYSAFRKVNKCTPRDYKIKAMEERMETEKRLAEKKKASKKKTSTMQ